ncbi:hypothetical protein Kuja_0040 [Vibrio phage vB_VchM_Kuja]|uniref:Uncharacterized protein n=1 Tax=Vibrio phage vB_VchM_Kuja TaxID=2686437 RepID=A0A6B9J5B8_9CAUD|nr:hypothetical protein HWC83_gp004 [Vibrio phage vB_VchM_Kuja]QGZ15995.1 hypothetical protein Kuja_0040 [Vibrio phage vB_VchM_Kuja]
MKDVRMAEASISLEELENFFRLIPNVLLNDAILQTWQEGSEDQLISAKALSEILKQLSQRTEGNGLVGQINDAPNCNVLTDELLQKLENFSLRFVGVVADVIQRNNIDVSNYVGNEVILLLVNEYGNSTIQYYDKAITSWRDFYPEEAAERTIDVETPQNALLRTFPMGKYRMIRVNLLGKTADKVQSSVVTISYTPGNSIANIGVEFEHLPQGRIFTVRANATSPNIEVRAETTQSNTSIRVKLLSAI